MSLKATAHTETTKTGSKSSRISDSLLMLVVIERITNALSSLRGSEKAEVRGTYVFGISKSDHRNPQSPEHDTLERPPPPPKLEA